MQIAVQEEPIPHQIQPYSVHINDMRQQKDFIGISFSGHKKTDVKKAYLKALHNGQIEPACYWSAELICAGHVADVWEIILLYLAKYVHLRSATVAMYLLMRYKGYTWIVKQGYESSGPLALRNIRDLRELFCEVNCVLCFAIRRHSFDVIKIKPEDVNADAIAERCRAPNQSFAERIYLEEDPVEVVVFINEFAYCISRESMLLQACYWLEMTLYYVATAKTRQRDVFQCERRLFANVIPKYQKEIVWMLWDCILHESVLRKNELLSQILESLLYLFCIDFVPGCVSRRKQLLYYACALLGEPVLFNRKILQDDVKHEVLAIKEAVHLIYAQVKQHEQNTRSYMAIQHGMEELEMQESDQTLMRLAQLREAQGIGLEADF